MDLEAGLGGRNKRRKVGETASDLVTTGPTHFRPGHDSEPSAIFEEANAAYEAASHSARVPLRHQMEDDKPNPIISSQPATIVTISNGHANFIKSTRQRVVKAKRRYGNGQAPVAGLSGDSMAIAQALDAHDLDLDMHEPSDTATTTTTTTTSTSGKRKKSRPTRTEDVDMADD